MEQRIKYIASSSRTAGEPMPACSECGKCETNCQTTCQLSCQGCDECDGCQAACTNCQDCVTCQKCNECQTICELEGQNVAAVQGRFDWGVSPAVNTTIAFTWTAEDWNTLIQRIRSAFAYTSANEEHPSEMNALSSLDIVSANLYNQLATNIRTFGGSCPNVYGNTEGTGDIIRANHANNLENGFNSMDYPADYCWECDSGCQVCDAGCQGCDSCQGCYSCERDA